MIYLVHVCRKRIVSLIAIYPMQQSQHFANTILLVSISLVLFRSIKPIRIILDTVIITVSVKQKYIFPTNTSAKVLLSRRNHTLLKFKPGKVKKN